MRDLCKTGLFARFWCQAQILILKIRECIPAVKVFALTRGFHAPRPYGQPDCCPILLSCRIALELGKTICFSLGPYIDLFKFDKACHRGQIKIQDSGYRMQ
ncbi:hypothetical protein C6A37_04725 [Desulfobacteraceae bacterium SEEP-SAG9]|nr:hypothetical protein C6A37_04725 [Desulfobacteraceae bacterium SEEP-SAG9]